MCILLKSAFILLKSVCIRLKSVCILLKCVYILLKSVCIWLHNLTISDGIPRIPGAPYSRLLTINPKPWKYRSPICDAGPLSRGGTPGSSKSSSPTPYHAWNDPGHNIIVNEEQRRNMVVTAPYLMTYKPPSNPYFDRETSNTWPNTGPNVNRKRRREELLQQVVNEGTFEFHENHPLRGDAVRNTTLSYQADSGQEDGYHNNWNPDWINDWDHGNAGNHGNTSACVDVAGSSDEELSKTECQSQAAPCKDGGMGIPISILDDGVGMLGVPGPLMDTLVFNEDTKEASSADKPICLLDSDG